MLCPLRQKISLINSRQVILPKNILMSSMVLGSCIGSTTLRPKIMSTSHAPTRASIALNETLKQDIERLQNHSIIEKVREPTSSESSLVTVCKPNGLLHVCLIRSHNPTPTNEDILPELASAKWVLVHWIS